MTGFNALYYVAAHYTSAINIGILQGALPIFVLAGAWLAHGARGEPRAVDRRADHGARRGRGGNARGRRCRSWRSTSTPATSPCWRPARVYAAYTVALRDRPDMPATAFFALLALIAAVTSLPLVAFEAYAGGLRMPTLQRAADHRLDRRSFPRSWRRSSICAAST